MRIYVRQGSLPTPFNAQESSGGSSQQSQTLIVPQAATTATYYVLVHSVSGRPLASYTLTATQSSYPDGVVRLERPGGNAGNVTMEIDGTNFTPNTTATLTGPGGTITASIDYVNASQVFATFNLKGAATGDYTLTVKDGIQTVTGPSLFTVYAGSAPSGTNPLSIDLSVPQYIRSGRTGTIVVSYTNYNNDDMAAPLLEISSTNPNVSFSIPDDPNDYVQSAQVLAVPSSGPAGIL